MAKRMETKKYIDEMLFKMIIKIFREGFRYYPNFNYHKWKMKIRK